MTFISRAKNWAGSIVPMQLINLQPKIHNDFQVTYEAIPAEKKYMLAVHPTSPIDKSNVIHTTYFSTLPITSLYYDVYQTFHSAHFTRCQIIENGTLPSFLSNLSQQDWQNGVYIIPSIKNSSHLNAQHPGSLTVTFYKSDKTLLGHINNPGLYENNEATPGIRKPAKSYDLYSNAFNPLFNVFINSGILIKFQSK